MASKFASRLGKDNVAVIEPSEVRNSINYNSSNKKHWINHRCLMNVWLTTLNYVLYSDALLSTYVDSGRRRIKKDGTICQAYGGRSSKGMNKSTNTDILMATIIIFKVMPLLFISVWIFLECRLDQELSSKIWSWEEHSYNR